jgi:hypothetical protein
MGAFRRHPGHFVIGLFLSKQTQMKLWYPLLHTVSFFRKMKQTNRDHIATFGSKKVDTLTVRL